jgi:hypothetical protein
MADNGYELGWDATIENDGPDFTVLPEGDYDFEVIEFERARHPGSENLPPCNKAIVHIRIKGAAGQTTIKHNLFLHSKCEGLLCAFFTAIGQRQKGQKFTMNWNAVVGSRGRAKVGIREFTNDRGEKLQFNEIKRFYEPTATAAGTGGFEAGRF